MSWKTGRAIQGVAGEKVESHPVNQAIETQTESPSYLDDVSLEEPWYDKYLGILRRNYHSSDVTSPFLGAWYSDESKMHLGMDLHDGFNAGLEDIRDVMIRPSKMHPWCVIDALDTLADHLTPIRYVQVIPEELFAEEYVDSYFEERFGTWEQGYRAAVVLFGRLIGAQSKFDCAPISLPNEDQN